MMNQFRVPRLLLVPLSRLCGRGVRGEGFDLAQPKTLTPDPSPAKPGEGSKTGIAIICALSFVIAGCSQPPAPVVKVKAGAAVDTTSTVDSVRDELKRPFAEPDQIRFASINSPAPAPRRSR